MNVPQPVETWQLILFALLVIVLIAVLAISAFFARYEYYRTTPMENLSLNASKAIGNGS